MSANLFILLDFPAAIRIRALHSNSHYIFLLSC